MIIKSRTVYEGVLNIPEASSGEFAIKHKIRPAGTTLRSGNMRTAIYGQKADDIFFPNRTRWHALTEDGGVWMTDDPIEQRQHDEQLRQMRGHVLVGGLGLGYAVVALAHNRGVKSITVVERSQDVVNLTWDATVESVKTVRPRLKLELVVDDLFTYLKAWTPVMADATVGQPFNWAFYDIWQSDGESTFHTVVIPLRELSRDKVGRVVCWNEDIMRGQLVMSLETRLRFALLPAETIANMGGSVPSIAQLAEPIGSIFHDWAVPFWIAARDSQIPVEMLPAAAHAYAQRYGL